MLQLGFNLISSGFIVTFASPERIHSHMLKLGRDRLCPHCCQSADFHIIRIPDGLPAYTKNDRPSPTRFSEAMSKIESAVEEIMEKLSKERPVSCIISNIFLVGIGDIANKFGVPKLDFFPSAATVLAIDIHVASRISEGVSTELQGQEEVITGIRGLAPLRKSDVAKELWISDSSDEMYQILFRPFSRIRESAGIVVNTVYELEAGVIDGMKENEIPVYAAGPLLPWCCLGSIKKIEELGEDEGYVLRWLGKQQKGSVVYISFGSFVVLTVEQVRELAKGLEESGLPFVWVMQCDGGEGLLPESFVKHQLSGHGLIVPWASQAKVLAHESVGVFLSHCGWNSTLESIAMGVPVVGWPVEQEQFTNLHLMVLWGLALPLPALRAAPIAATLAAAIHSPTLRARTQSLRSAALTAASTTFPPFVDALLAKLRPPRPPITASPSKHPTPSLLTPNSRHIS